MRRRSSNDIFLFNEEEFNNLDRLELKISKLEDTIVEFNSKFKSDTPIITSKGNISAATTFWNTLVNNFTYIIHDKLEDLLITFEIFFQNPSTLPVDEKILSVIEFLFGQIKTESKFQEIIAESIKLIFKIPWVCNLFLERELFSGLFVQFINEEKYEKLCLILQNLNSSEFTAALTKFIPEIVILPTFRFIVCTKKEFQDKIPTNVFVLLITHLISWICKAFTPQVIVDLLADGVIYDINTILSTCSAKSVLGVYSSLVEWDAEYPIHPIALKVFHQIYVLPTTSNQLRISILEFISSKSSIYNQNFALQANTSGWFLPEVCKISNLFTPFCEMIRGIARVDTKFIIPVFLLLVDKIVPPHKGGILIDSIISFLLELLTDFSMPEVLFNNDLCLEKLMLEPSLSDFANFLTDKKVQVFLSKMFAGRTSESQPVHILQRLTDSGKFMNQEKLTEFVVTILTDNFNPGILYYLIVSLDDDYVEDIIYLILTPWRSDIVTLFNEGDCFSIVERKIGVNIKWTKAFLKFVNTIVTHESDHFFDDWVIQQPSSSLVFTLQNDDISEYVVPSSSIHPIPIPSLVPLCNPFITDSYYNLYMLGAYAMPVYRKFNFKYDKISNIKEIACRFIYPEDFMILVDTNPALAATLLKIPNEPFSLFEFYPNIGPGWLEPLKPISCPAICFRIRFNNNSIQKVPFVTFNNQSLAIEDNLIFSPNNDKSFKIDLKTWYQILIYSEKSSSSIKVYINTLEFCQVPASSDNLVTLKEIGNSEIPGTAFFVQNNVNILSDLDSIQNYTLPKTPNVELVPKKSCALSLFHSTIHIFKDHNNIIEIFNRFTRSKSNKTDYLRIVSQIPNICEINDYTFFSNFLSVLKQNKEYCETGWFTEFAFSMYWVIDLKQRTRIFNSILSDFELWSSFDESYLIEYLQSVYKYITTYNDKIDIGYLIDNHCLETLYYLIFCVKKKNLAECFIRLFLFIFQFANMAIIKRMSKIIMSSKMWLNLKDLKINLNEIRDFILEFDFDSQIFSVFIQALVVFQAKKNLEVFTDEDLLFLILITNNTCAEAILEYLISKNSEIDLTNLSVFTLGIKKFPSNVKLWSFLYTRLFDCSFDIYNYTKTPPIKKNFFIYPIFTLMMAVFHEKVTEDLTKKLSDVFNDTFISQLTNLTTINLDVFIYLLRFCRRNLPTVNLIELEVYNSNYISKSDFPQLKEIYQNNFAEFLTKFLNLTRLDGYDGVPESFCNFMSLFLAKLVHSQINDFMSKSPRAISIIVQQSCPEIVKAFLVNLIGMMKNASKKTIQSYLEAVCYFYLHFPSYFNDGLIIWAVFDFIKENQSVAKNRFSGFFIVTLSLLDDKQLEIALEILENHASSFQFNQCLYLLFGLFEKRPELSEKFSKNLLKQLKKLNFPHNDANYDVIQNYIKNMTELDIKNPPKEVVESLFVLKQKLISDWEGTIEIILAEELNDTEGLIVNTYKIVTLLAFNTYNVVNNLSLAINQFAKNQEKFLSTKPFLKCEKTLSFRRHPFSFPAQTPSVVYPSPFPIYSPSDKPPQAVRPQTKVFDFVSNFDTKLEIVDYLPMGNFKFAGLFNIHKGDILSLFKSTYGDFSTISNCQLSRLDIKVPCICFFSSKGTLYLCGASFVDNEISLSEVTTQSYTTFYESALLGEFGEFRLFCGRIILKVKSDSEILVRKINYNTEQNSFEFFNISNGNYIIDFESPNQSIVTSNLINMHNLESITQKWRSNEMSNFEYLNYVNFFAQRSYSELSCYPIYPRTLSEMNGDKIESEPLRDLNTPIQLLGDLDQQHKSFVKRFQQQKFFFPENVSNPMIVTTLHVRVIPFCRYQWLMNEGWDAGDRNFLSVPFQLQVSAKTVYEQTAELFIAPEYLLNLNNFMLKNGVTFDIVLPKWSSNVFSFVNFHRMILESKSVRDNLNIWIDFIFGYKQKSKDDFNIFNPLAYFEPKSDVSNDKKEQQKKWMSFCGQVPIQVFSVSHPSSLQVSKMIPGEIKILFEIGKPPRLSFSQILNQITIDGKVVLSDSDMIFARSVSMSNFFIAVNFVTSFVKIYLFIDSKVIFILSLQISNPRITCINDNVLVACTSGDGYLIFWSISSGAVIKKYSTDETVFDIKLDDATSSFFVCFSNSICQYSSSGFLITTINANARLRSVATFGNGFSLADRFVLGGCMDGSVKIFGFSKEMKPSLVREIKLAKSPIVKLVSYDSPKIISAFTKL
ncbi:Beige/BEACH domain containing protein [Trichomonas vaginalis G3]|uniref:Beige/BEACH domain containing protein n=1 Tax=Trichomonas vaginalis (strain ATCC PRA-98 / G3) TaxID=412133 RepID=A2F1N8_TRIV3|nr:platelet formation protein family [Trichomonas vaginalis G3]EAY01203.1 Beige/BEACH domain containing protein [Trichomonas vaginalis G3]KAI5513170.1 platelet formation protein family [Trichomonas vaginalis G3]|eukprot:XP_001314039.1 Beige/BEACH domain containing protein [Trichomonas vaginalis G3]